MSPFSSSLLSNLSSLLNLFIFIIFLYIYFLFSKLNISEKNTIEQQINNYYQRYFKNQQELEELNSPSSSKSKYSSEFIRVTFARNFIWPIIVIAEIDVLLLAISLATKTQTTFSTIFLLIFNLFLPQKSTSISISSVLNQSIDYFSASVYFICNANLIRLLRSSLSSSFIISTNRIFYIVLS